MNENVTKEIVKARKVIKQKYKALRAENNATQARFNQVYKPLIDPLEKIARVTATPGEIFVKKNEEKENKERELKLPNQKSRGTKRFSRDFTLINQSREKKTREGSSSDNIETEEESNTSEETSDLSNNERWTNPTDMSVDLSVLNTEMNQSNFSERELDDGEWMNKFIEHMGPKSKLHVQSMFTNEQYRDNVFGPYFSNDNKLKLGSQFLDFDKDDNIIIGAQKYPGSPGLFQLIFKSDPTNFPFITSQDREIYKQILYQTNAHRLKYSPNGKIKSSSNIKYKSIISELFPPKKTGQGLGRKTTMTLTNRPIDYMYYDDPNELVERLELLIGETNAGHTGHVNEIQEIIEELKECGLIIKSPY